jgi:hypothetical protein
MFDYKEYRRNYYREYAQKHPEKWREYRDRYRKKLKLQVISHYGGKCICCGENHIEFLTIDHVNGGGTKERETTGLRGNQFYRWLIKNNFPEDYQILCANCNMAKGKDQFCPVHHKK